MLLRQQMNTSSCSRACCQTVRYPPWKPPPPGWRFGLRVGLDQRSYSTPGPVSAWMGGRHPDQLSLAIPPRVGTMSTSLRWKGNRMSSE